jgi:hypothetical protein
VAIKNWFNKLKLTYECANSYVDMNKINIKFRVGSVFLLVFIWAWVSGCEKSSGVQVYTVSKPQVQLKLPSQAELEWKKPSAWKELDASGMRLGSFSIEGSHSQQAQVSIVRLAGSVGSLLANVNRWRGQLRLEAISSEELSSVVSERKVGAQSVSFVSLESKVSVAQENVLSKMVVAIIRKDSGALFVKLMGPSELVSDNEVVFNQFVASIKDK